MGVPTTTALVAASLAVAAGLGYVASTEHAKRLSAEHAQQVWKDSLAVAVKHADSATVAFRALDSAYHHRPPSIRPAGRIDTLLVPVAGDTVIQLAAATEAKRLADSLQAACSRDSAEAEKVIAAGERAVDSLQRAVKLATHPPPAPKPSRVTFGAVGAYDLVSKQPYLGADVQLHLGSIIPFAGAGMTLGGANQGQLLLGLRYTFH